MSANPKTVGAYDVERVWRDFPILAREVHGRPLVFLDSAASSHRPRPVIDAVDAYEKLYRDLQRSSELADESVGQEADV